ncbi:MAG TPA: hypothetical protein VIM11_12335 [Tepidisphaeraceae bacterium]|jgi:hypothetical protein
MKCNKSIVLAGLIACGVLAGCEGRPTLFPNSDANLRKTSTEFAADAAKRFPYPGEAATKAGEISGRAEVDVMLGQLQILNSSDDDWKEIDVWVNKSHVCHIPIIPKGKEKVETVAFAMMYNAQGKYFSTENGKNPVNRVEILRDGKLYTIPVRLAD